MTLTIYRLNELLSYDREADNFTWLVATNGRRKVGEIAGSLDRSGYLIIKIDRKNYKAHRLVWLLTTGEWPDGIIDHKDGNKRNNRYSNLRIATASQNNTNSRIYKNNTSGYKGVFLRKNKNIYEAWIRKHNRRIYLGSYKDAYEAHLAYCEASKKYHGEFSRIS